MIKKDINEIYLREKLIKLAKLQLNKLYEHKSHGPDTFDCAGYLWYLYNLILNIDIYENGYGLSTTTKIMTSSYGKLSLFNENKDLNNLKKGDILFFHRQSLNDFMPRVDNKYPGHCGLYLENNYFIHCSKKTNNVSITKLEDNKYWKKVLVASKDIISYIK